MYVGIEMLPPPKYKNNLASGVFYFNEGLRLIWKPELRLYIIVPLIVNLFLFVILTGALIHYYGGFIDSVMENLPTYLAPLAWIVWIFLGILILIVYGYSFNIITNIIAAPFYGMLASRVELLLTGKAPEDEPIGKMVLRTTCRELSKLIYFLTRGFVVILIVILLGTLTAAIPLVNLISPAIGMAWSAWSMAIQYSDYAADNNQLGFKSLRECLWNKKFSSLGFGGIIMLCSVTPIVNIIAMPVAVAGGTLFWLRELKGCQQGFCEISDEV